MAKDAKGHGSNARGASAGGSYQNIDKNLRGPGKHVGYAGGDIFHIGKSGAGGYVGIGQKNAGLVSGKTLGDISAKLTRYDGDAQLATARIAAMHGIQTDHLNPAAAAHGGAAHGFGMPQRKG